MVVMPVATASSVVDVFMSTTNGPLGSIHGTGLGEHTECPPATALLLAHALALHAALRLGNLLHLAESVAAVALSAILGASHAEPLGGAVLGAEGVANLAEVGTDLTRQDAVLAIAVAAGILEACDGLGVLRSLVSRLGRLAIDGCGRPDGLSLPHCGCLLATVAFFRDGFRLGGLDGGRRRSLDGAGGFRCWCWCCRLVVDPSGGGPWWRFPWEGAEAGWP